jgi:hypothetical protein
MHIKIVSRKKFIILVPSPIVGVVGFMMQKYCFLVVKFAESITI